ncbi:kelch-like protein 18 [Eurytemora carolleeae]|uniref:kelch-like protein 18 n=1 Tax=Eurytemora carolleeae TaxID=1294199 RepID=UPI000C784F41|nr:kelch-like protein 18 [Eurytemora carolleeae]|eukprot:XP_023348579.1 kelch-like protein 18 [Eurytemora affinis]
MDWIGIENMTVARRYFTLTTLGDKILAAGGDTPQGWTATVEVFDGSSWKLQNYKLTSPRKDHCAVPISESEVMLIGGYYGGFLLSLVETYSIEKGFIAELPSMPTSRYGIGCSMFKGEIWTAGGTNGNGYILDVVEILTPGFTGGTWRSGPKLAMGRSWLRMEVLDNSLVVFGGAGAAESLEMLDGEEWREEPLQYGHYMHASVSISC